MTNMFLRFGQNCKKLVIVTVIWSVIYAICLQFVTIKSSHVNVAEAGNLFFSHMWYMPMIIGMYLSMPFVASALEKYETDTIWNASIVFSFLAFLLPFITTVLAMHGIQNVNIQYFLDSVVESRTLYNIRISS